MRGGARDGSADRPRLDPRCRQGDRRAPQLAENRGRSRVVWREVAATSRPRPPGHPAVPAVAGVPSRVPIAGGSHAQRHGAHRGGWPRRSSTAAGPHHVRRSDRPPGPLSPGGNQRRSGPSGLWTVLSIALARYGQLASASQDLAPRGGGGQQRPLMMGVEPLLMSEPVRPSHTHELLIRQH